jgi:Fe-S-cluster containining protein
MAENPFTVINKLVYFNGNCDECRPYCGAVCCSAYGFVGLTEDEVKTGLYKYKEVEQGCQCEVCERMRELDLRYMVPKQPDGSCVYLNGARLCSIYGHRPAVCREYSCVNLPFKLVPAS